VTFGWNLDGENSLDSANTADIAMGRTGHSVRFYPVRDHNGNIIANTYFMTMDYAVAGSQNYDFNDELYVISNIKPMGN